MKTLNQHETQMIAAGNATNACYEAHGYEYVTPQGDIQFNAFKIINADGSVYGLGLIPEGWKQISDKVVIKEGC
jgi:hypothetical protein